MTTEAPDDANQLVGCAIQPRIQPVGSQWTGRPRADGNRVTIGISSKTSGNDGKGPPQEGATGATKGQPQGCCPRM